MIKILVWLFYPNFRGKVTFFGGSVKVSGYFKLLSSRGGYLISAGTISLAGIRAL